VYELTVSVSDDNASATLNVYVAIQDIDDTAPVITLLGDSNITHEAGAEYVDAGARWNDSVDGNGSADTNGTVNHLVPGTYQITYSFTDSSGNAAQQVVRTIHVVDTTPPVISLIGDANVTHLAATTYIDEGANWTDIVDGNGTAYANGSVDSDTPGVYQITYSYTDAAGNAAEPVLRTINVVDSDAPVITLLGDSNITHEAGAEYVDAGARWNDSVDGNGSADTNGTVNHLVPGTYQITYSFTDSSGNAAQQVVRTIHVVDTTPPVISLIGDANVTHLAATTYIDEGANWTDIVDGNGTAYANGSVDSDTPGVYQITYSYTDAAGNAAEPVLRTINVVDSDTPVITLLGDSNITHEAGPEYVDAGAQWNDSVDGNGTADANGTVDHLVPGIYQITYSFTDSSGNAAQEVTRTIHVVDTTPPVITLIGDANVTHLASTTYIDEGAKWTDIVDGNGTADANGSVDSNTPGIYQIIYTKTDTNGNAAEPVVRTIHVVDSDTPVITLLGDSNITHEAGAEYVDAGAQWNDSVDGNGTADANGTVDHLVPGIYQITYSFTDSSGNAAQQIVRTINVVDTTPPVITLIGDANITHLASTTYIDQGANWTDVVDGNGTADANGSVDSNTPGIYQITYSKTDANGNAADPVVRTINLVDSDAPVLTLLGDSNITHEAGAEYVDAGAQWNDSVDGNGTADANGTVDHLVPGIYHITYTYTDSSGNAAVPVTRTIKVEDTTPPVITLIGDANITHLASTTYIDQGANWTDVVDGNGTADANGSVDSNTPGIYQITYSKTDANGNAADPVVRTINLVDSDAPVLTLLGDSNITHEAGAEYVDAGAQWNDSVDGNGTADANGTVDHLVPGIYHITYTYTDSSGNAAVPVTRTIKVEDTTPPVITLIGDQNVTLEAGLEYVEEGAAWNDLVDGNGTAWINGDVDSNVPGIYELQYDYNDSHGNSAESVFRYVTITNRAPSEIFSDRPLQFEENLNPFSTIAQFDAFDPDEIHSIRFSLAESNNSDSSALFSLDANGSLRTASYFDYETDPHSYTIVIKATDEHNASIEENFQLELLDVYENRAPENLSISSSSILENQPAGTIVGILQGMDRDLNDSLTYSMTFLHEDSYMLDPNNSIFADGEPIIKEQQNDQNNSTYGSLDYDLTNSELLDPTQLDRNQTELLDNQISEPLFYLDPNGSLVSLRPLDFETDIIFSDLLIRVEDQDGAYFEKAFQIEIINVVEDLDNDGIEDPFDDDIDGDGFTNEDEILNGTDPYDQYSYSNKPILNTGEGLLDENGSIQLFGNVQYNGAGIIEDFGFVVSSGISLDKSKSTVYWVQGVGEPNDFSLQASESPFPEVLYFRAWARNAAGYGLGPVKKLKIPEAPQIWWGEITDQIGEWKSSVWFGAFIYYEKGWLFHSKLGWLFSSPDEKDGVWLWNQNQGWLWTKEGVWPYLFKHQSKNWLYFTTSRNGRSVFYDYSSASYLGLDNQPVEKAE
jgi:putative intracellular protease/amidase